LHNAQQQEMRACVGFFSAHLATIGIMLNILSLLFVVAKIKIAALNYYFYIVIIVNKHLIIISNVFFRFHKSNLSRSCRADNNKFSYFTDND